MPCPGHMSPTKQFCFTGVHDSRLAIAALLGGGAELDQNSCPMGVEIKLNRTGIVEDNSFSARVLLAATAQSPS